MNYASAVAKKMLKHFGFDAELLASFSQKQRQLLLNLVFETPLIKAEKPGTVPRQYIKAIQSDVFRFMKTNYWGDPENKLNYIELATYGLGFVFSTIIHVNNGVFTGTPQEAIAQEIKKKFESVDIINEEAFGEVFKYIDFKMKCYSKINFRLYGFRYTWVPCDNKVHGLGSERMLILLTVQECEPKMFLYNKQQRIGFRMILTSNGIYMPSWAIIWKKEIFPDVVKDEQLDIYVQSHALHRFKERIDILDTTDRNYLIQYALCGGRHIVRTEKQLLFACSIHKCPIGYFTFFLQKNDLIINTFIPLVSKTAPLGRKLHELLHLEKDELTYLGMDKISFFLQVDFDQIPILKQALIDSGIWESKLAIESVIVVELDEGKSKFDENKTQFVKQFFDKLEKHQKYVASHADAEVQEDGTPEQIPLS